MDGNKNATMYHSTTGWLASKQKSYTVVRKMYNIKFKMPVVNLKINKKIFLLLYPFTLMFVTLTFD